MERRDFLKFLGFTGLAAQIVPNRLLALNEHHYDFQITPSFDDDLLLGKSLKYNIIAKWGDQINSSGDTFGFNNDYTAFIPFESNNPKDGLLWVNHESTHPLFVSGYNFKGKKTKEQVDKERYSVGGSIIRIKQDDTGTWNLVKDDKYNRRIHGGTKIPFSKGISPTEQTYAIGTFANCGGGVTPWNTILTCEENYHDFYGEIDFSKRKEGIKIQEKEKWAFNWDDVYDESPLNYGWVVEVNPFDGKTQKHMALGRFGHESATVVEAKNGNVVVYMGDDKVDQCIYKFISHNKNDLSEGTLYVANLKKGKWIPLEYKEHKSLQKQFSDQREILTFTRQASALVGGTPCDRPEDIEVHPVTKSVFIALTGNPQKNNPYGSILKIDEKNADPLSLEFTHETFLMGGKSVGVSSPDNMAFDKKNNLWLTVDISTAKLGKGLWESFGNNGLFFIPTSGPQKGKAIQVGSAPKHAELTGPSFSSDGKTLFLSVQHPGEITRDINHPTSKWPFDGSNIPKPAVVAIQGGPLGRILT
ncbi:MAG: DUF839 domain-containing protein [Halobacteriovoraceae bacterium]|nr:DUF839 domain-containing protein [Halobacteriovoraceae bacterium]